MLHVTGVQNNIGIRWEEFISTSRLYKSFKKVSNCHFYVWKHNTLHIIVYLISVWYPHARDTNMKVCVGNPVSIHLSFIIRRYLLLPNKITSLFWWQRLAFQNHSDCLTPRRQPLTLAFVQLTVTTVHVLCNRHLARCFQRWMKTQLPPKKLNSMVLKN